MNISIAFTPATMIESAFFRIPWKTTSRSELVMIDFNQWRVFIIQNVTTDAERGLDKQRTKNGNEN